MNELFKIALNCIIALMGALMLIIFNDINGTIKKLVLDVGSLNTKIAVVIENSHQLKEIQADQELRLRVLELKKK